MEKHDPLEQVRHFAYLDALRGVAILGVVFVHAGNVTLDYGGGGHFLGQFASGYGRYGVQLFYMLSAFTLMMSFDERRGEPRAVLNFYVRRIFRIAPLYYLVLLLTFFTSRMAGSEPVPVGDALLGAFFLQGVKPSAINTVVVGGWSIAVEMMFYAILPAIQRWLRDWRGCVAAFFVVGVPLGMLSSHLAMKAGTDATRVVYFAVYWFPVELAVFVMGMGTYAMWRQVLSPWRSKHSREAVRLASAGLLLMVPVPTLLEPVVHHLPLYVISCSFPPLILGLALWSWRPLVNSLTQLLGRVSFSVYLLHFFVLLAIDRLFLGPNTVYWMTLLKSHPDAAIPALFCLIVAVSLPVAMLSLRWIEKPGMAQGKRLLVALGHAADAPPIGSGRNDILGR